MPLRRHPALLALSREHHPALVLARAVQLGGSARLRARLPSEPRALARHVTKVFAEELEPHFAAEDELLLPAARGHNAALDAVCNEVEDDHAQLRAMIAELGSPALDESQIGSWLDRFGKLLEVHVRREERSFYEGIQEALAESALVALGEQLAARRPDVA